MARAIREAIEATRDDDDAVVSFNNNYVHITWTYSVPLAAEELIRKGWLMRPSSARNESVTLFK